MKLSTLLPSLLVLGPSVQAGSLPSLAHLDARQELHVSPTDVGETVRTLLEGRVIDAAGSPAMGTVVVTSAGGQTVTAADGSFEIAIEMPLAAHSVQITAVRGAGSSRAMSSAVVPVPVPGARTIVGELTLQQGGSCQPAWLPTFGGQPGVDQSIHALAVFDDGSGAGPSLYAGGAFATAGGTPANHVARWDGTGWSALGSGPNGPVRALAVFDDGTGPALYAGGTFLAAGDVSASRIARWDGTSWTALGGGLNGPVLALTGFDDGGGGGPALYAGGDFRTADGLEVNFVARWDGSTWSDLGGGIGSGFSSEIVYSLAVFDDGSGAGPELYAGGRFDSAGGTAAKQIARWDGSSWSPVGGGISGISILYVSALTVHDEGGGPALYAGGRFSTAGGMPADAIARWDGASWSALGSGFPNFEVTGLASFDDGSGSGPALYAGGSFVMTGSVTADHVAKWDGSSWSAAGVGTNSSVRAFTVHDDGSGAGPALYAGGNFTQAGGAAAGRIARWDGSVWSALGSGLSDAVRAVTAFDDGVSGPALYVGGSFTGAVGVDANHVARWDGAGWASLGGGMDADVRALAAFDDGGGGGPALYAGGDFTQAGGSAAARIARWDGNAWWPLGTGTDGGVHALAVFDDGSGPALYAAGAFTRAGAMAADHVAKWDGSSWSPLGPGLNDWVWSLAVLDDGTGPGLYAGGRFSAAGGAPASRVARWDGGAWSALGSGTNDAVRALAAFDDGSGAGPALYVGGQFTSAGGVSASRVARWDGASWSALGSGTTAIVYTLEVFDDGQAGPALYAGGLFTVAGGVAARRVARWDGADWSALGTGMDSTVWALEVFDDGGDGPALYAGGVFRVTADSGDSYLARWGGCAPSGPGTAFCFGSACPCGNDDAQAGCVHSSGNGALLSGSGSASIAADDLVLAVSGAPASQTGILYMGGSQTQAPFGDGLRCVAAGAFAICRFPIHGTGSGGSFVEGPGIVAFSHTLGTECHIGPGETWHFQGWFRDPAGPCSGGFNLTNGLSVLFAP